MSYPLQPPIPEFRIALEVQSYVQRFIENNPDLYTDQQLKQELLNIQELQAQKIKDALTKVIHELPEDSHVGVPDRDQSYLDIFRDLNELKQSSPEDPGKKVHKLLQLFGYLERFWVTSAAEPKLALLQHISQMITIADDQTIKKLTEETFSHQDPRFRGEMCYALGLSGQSQYLPLVRRFLRDPAPWVRAQASGAVKRLEALEGSQVPPTVEEAIVQALGNLLDFIEKTREWFYDEHQRYQLLARLRKILREQVFDYFPADSAERSLVTAIINATNRTVAKKFRKRYLDIFKDSLVALQDGCTDVKTVAQLEKRLLEVDDE